MLIAGVSAGAFEEERVTGAAVVEEAGGCGEVAGSLSGSGAFSSAGCKVAGGVVCSWATRGETSKRKIKNRFIKNIMGLI